MVVGVSDILLSDVINLAPTVAIFCGASQAPGAGCHPCFLCDLGDHDLRVIWPGPGQWAQSRQWERLARTCKIAHSRILDSNCCKMAEKLGKSDHF